ncbi:2OG-Fe(II) oxygenase [Paraburkholderia megapolitana]|uniref:2OG-Fe(II) oxygenase superfamily protein n=1 Tax=Paraburkholderia megapolitana TaxID=420953 RepID=A0A1I3WDU6_9BURK|nr:2OG-Fe(II) oxygenase [Paraburkholderia megapolitana]QDQ82216.1 hypothetical protein FNZ07_13020 [Paraburkholderia megapolitana]SFK04596.1 2OG-Fe(II) oxygenase superfamily protein [Paraburkholderia megapolitana]
MKPFSFDKNLIAWVESETSAGVEVVDIALTLTINEGYSFPIACRIVESVIRNHQPAATLFDPAYRVEQGAFPEYVETGLIRDRLESEGVRIAMELIAPRVCLLTDFLSENVCKDIIEQAEFKIPDLMSENSTEYDIRLFSSSENILIDRVVERVAEAFCWPASRFERAKLIHYNTGGRFAPHSEYFVGSVENQRVANVVIFLNSAKEGGGTLLSNLGLRVYPVSGNLLFFSYPDAVRNSGTEHAGEAITEGEKWILSLVMREKDTVHELEEVEVLAHRERAIQART